jgi:hypothetical protein
LVSEAINTLINRHVYRRFLEKSFTTCSPSRLCNNLDSFWELQHSLLSAMSEDQIGNLHEEKKKTPLQMISQGVCLPGIPRHPTFASQRAWLLERMALAFRVFARKGYTDGMAGHISVRDPENPHTFWTVGWPHCGENCREY